MDYPAVFVPLREFAAECAGRDQDYSLLHHLYTCAREHLLLNLPPGFLEEALDAGRCLVCLDGLDEVWAVAQRKSVRDAVKALAARFPRSRYLVTSRIVGYENAPLDRRDFVHHTILPFEDEDIRLFVRKWYEARERDPVQRKQKADDLIGTIEREPRIRSLAQNPLLLTIIALVHRIEAELPHERVKLYDKCVTALVETWEEVKGLSLEERQRLFYRYRRRLLERLAYELHAGAEEAGQLRTVKEGDLELLLSRFLMENRRLGFADDPDGAREEAQAFIHLARGRTGVLVERGEGVFGFPHLTFQEYLAACDIENRCIHRGVEAIWEEIKPCLHDPHWREVILLLLGSLNKYDEPPTLLVERILEAGEGDKFEPVLHRHLYLAAHVLADRVDVADELHREIVNKLLTVAQQGFGSVTWVLSLFGEARMERKGERADAFAALSSLEGDMHAAEGLLGLARDKEVDAWVRREAVSALGNLGRTDETVLEGLLEFARAEEVDAGVRREAVSALGQLGSTDKKVLEGPLGLVQDEGIEDWLRCAAASVLGELGWADEEVLEGLLGLARDEGMDAWVRREAASALGQLGQAEEAGEILLGLARDEEVDADMRLAAAYALGQLGQTDKAGEILLGLARDEEVNPDVRSAAAFALAQLGQADEIALDGLLALAHNEKVDAEVRREAASALGRLGRADETVIEGLLGLAKNEEVDVWLREEAASALGRLGRADEASDILLRLAQDEEVNAGMRHAAAKALGQLGRADEASDILLRLVRDEEVNAGVRRTAASTLGQLGRADESVIEILLGLAQGEDVDAGVRCVAASTLGQLGRADEEVLEGLLELTQNEKVKNWVRRDAAKALGQLGQADEKVLERLLGLARDKEVEDWLCSAAYESLKALAGVATD